MKFTRNRNAAEDLSQKVFLKVFQSLDRFGPPWRLDAWIARIAYNLATDEVRAAHKENEVLARYAQVGSQHPVTPEEYVLLKDCQRIVSAAMEAEPDASCRETAKLFFEQGRSVREISAAQNISETAVTSRLSRFRGRLMKKLSAAALESMP